MYRTHGLYYYNHQLSLPSLLSVFFYSLCLAQSLTKKKTYTQKQKTNKTKMAALFEYLWFFCFCFASEFRIWTECMSLGWWQELLLFDALHKVGPHQRTPVLYCRWKRYSKEINVAVKFSRIVGSVSSTSLVYKNILISYNITSILNHTSHL